MDTPAPTNQVLPPLPTETVISPSDSTNNWPLIGVVIGILVLLVGGIIFAFFSLPGFSAKPVAPVAPSSVVAPPKPIAPVAPVVPAPPPAPVNQIQLNVLKPTNGSTVATSKVLVSGETVPNADVSVNDLETKADTKGNFSVNLSLTEGENPIIVSAFDTDGNNSEQELTVTYAP